VQTSLMAGFIRLSALTWVELLPMAHYNGEYERTFETEIAGVRLRTPMMAIHTVAAGGGRFCNLMAHVIGWDQSQLGESGTSFVLRGGPLTVTDCNVMVGFTAKFLS